MPPRVKRVGSREPDLSSSKSLSSCSRIPAPYSGTGLGDPGTLTMSPAR